VHEWENGKIERAEREVFAAENGGGVSGGEDGEVGGGSRRALVGFRYVY
jgi:hypothetical protein